MQYQELKDSDLYYMCRSTDPRDSGLDVTIHYEEETSEAVYVTVGCSTDVWTIDEWYEIQGDFNE